MVQVHGDGLRQRPSRPALHGERGDGRVRGGPRERARNSSTPARSTRSCSPSRRPRPTTSWRIPSGAMAIGEGDEIILSIMEHHSNIVPWHFLRERKGAVIKWAPVDDEGNFLVEEFEKLFTPRTKIVAITHMSNVLGTVTPIKEIIRIAHAHGVPVLVDGAQGAVHLTVDVRDLDADFYVFTGHKVYGPTGIGVLYGKRELAGADAALPGRRRDDPRGPARSDHLQRAAAPLRGGHAADHRGDRPRRRPALHDAARPREHPGARGGALGLCPRAPGADELAPHHRPGQGQGRHHRLRDEGRACPRRRHGDRPAGRGGPGRHPLRHAAPGALRRHLHLPGVLRALQHLRGSR